MIRAALLTIALLAPMPILAATVTTPGPMSLKALSVGTVTTGGTAVNAIASGGRMSGGWLANPSTASAALCINEVGAAATTSSGNTTCIAPGASYVIAPANGPVSVNASDDGHVFSGLGFVQ